MCCCFNSACRHRKSTPCSSRNLLNDQATNATASSSPTSSSLFFFLFFFLFFISARFARSLLPSTPCQTALASFFHSHRLVFSRVPFSFVPHTSFHSSSKVRPQPRFFFFFFSRATPTQQHEQTNPPTAACRHHQPMFLGGFPLLLLFFFTCHVFVSQSSHPFPVLFFSFACVFLGFSSSFSLLDSLSVLTNHHFPRTTTETHAPLSLLPAFFLHTLHFSDQTTTTQAEESTPLPTTPFFFLFSFPFGPKPSSLETQATKLNKAKATNKERAWRAAKHWQATAVPPCQHYWSSRWQCS